MNILIVDDIAINRKLLNAMLEGEGHVTLEASDGVEALRILSREKMDAVVSDILMPRMDGYRLCHEIRKDKRLRDLPIVIYTATYLSQSDEKLAFDMGADKFLKKPSSVGTILAALYEASAMQHTVPQPDALQQVEVLKEYSDRLVAKLEERSIELEQQARELAQANQRLTILDDSKNVFLNLISHEVRTPLFGILAVSELILEGMQSTEQNNELREVFQQSRRNILSLVDDALLLTEIDVNGEWFRSVPVSLSVVLKRAIENVTAFAESRNVMLGLPPAGMHFVVGDEDLLVRAMHALLETAVKFSEKSKTVWLTNEVGPDSVRLIIETEGRGIPSSAVPKFFDLFSIGEVVTRAGDLGLRAPVASRILGLFGGSVSVANQEPAGIRLTISLRMIDSQHINRAADSLVTSEI